MDIFRGSGLVIVPSGIAIGTIQSPLHGLLVIAKLGDNNLNPMSAISEMRSFFVERHGVAADVKANSYFVANVIGDSLRAVVRHYALDLFSNVLGKRHTLLGSLLEE